MLVSVIIPYYNRPEKLRRCLHSIAKQTYSRIEIIVVDDCSDHFPDDLKRGINYVKNTTNLGPGESRNQGMRMAAGEYLAFLDCDDYWHPSFIEKCMVKFMDSKKPLAMIYAQTLSVDGNKTYPKREGVMHSQTILPSILTSGRPWATSSCVWKAAIVENIRWQKTRCWEDYAFDTSVAAICNQVDYVKEDLVYYDVTGDDKLSKQFGNQSAIEKSKSLVSMASDIVNSPLNTPYIINAMTIQVLNSLILQKKFKDSNLQIRENSFKSLQLLKGDKSVNFVGRVMKLPKKISLYLLRKYRRQL